MAGGRYCLSFTMTRACGRADVGCLRAWSLHNAAAGRIRRAPTPPGTLCRWPHRGRAHGVTLMVEHKDTLHSASRLSHSASRLFHSGCAERGLKGMRLAAVVHPLRIETAAWTLETAAWTYAKRAIGVGRPGRIHFVAGNQRAAAV